MLTAAPLRQLLTMSLGQLIATCPWIQHRHIQVKGWGLGRGGGAQFLCLNVFSAQVMLTAAPLKQLLTMPLVVVQLISTCPWIQHRYIQLKGIGRGKGIKFPCLNTFIAQVKAPGSMSKCIRCSSDVNSCTIETATHHVTSSSRAYNSSLHAHGFNTDT